MLMYWKNRAVNGAWKLQRRVYEVLRNEDGVGTVEVVLLILVATGLVLIFKDRITELVTNIFGKIHVPGREDMRQKAGWCADVHRAVSCADKSWSERKQSTPGYMTVYLALVMGILLSLILAVLTAVRISTIRMYIECCADMALDSALAEYHREMLDQYDLFFIDTAYQTGDPSYHRTEEHIFRYMERNLRPQEEFPTAGAKDLLGLSTEAVELLQAGVATDDGGTVLQYHIVQYMKDISGLSLAETLLEQGNQLEDLQGRDLEAEWDAAEESLKEEIFRRKKLQDKDWDGEIPETPSDAVRATRSEGILGSSAQGMQLSSACLSGAGRPSVRHLNSGTGLSDGKEAANSLVDQGLLYAYILKKMRQLRAGERKTARSLTRWNIFCSSRRRIRKI